MPMFKLILIPILLAFSLFAEEEGNFSLPSSQQPSGVFAFGGNVIDKGERQIFLLLMNLWEM